MFKVGDKVICPKVGKLSKYGITNKDIYTVEKYFYQAETDQFGLVLMEIKSDHETSAFDAKSFRKLNKPKSAIKELVENFVETEEKIDVEQPVEI